MKVNIYSLLKTLLFSIENGKNITSGVQLLVQNAKSKKEKKLYQNILTDLKDGISFSQSLKKNKLGSMDVVGFMSIAEKGVALKTSLQKIIKYMEIKENFQKESSDKINLPFIYFSLATIVVLGIKFIAVPLQTERASEYSKEIKNLIADHLNFANTMTDILFIVLCIVCAYFTTLLLAVFSETRSVQNVGKKIALKLPMTRQIVIKFEKFILFSMLGEMLQSGITYKQAMQSAIQTATIKQVKIAFQNSLDKIKNEGRFILESELFEDIERDLLIGAGTTAQIGMVFSEISKRSREDALLLCSKFFRMIVFMSILLMTFAVFIEFYTVVLTQILIQKGLIDMTKGVPM